MCSKCCSPNFKTITAPLVDHLKFRGILRRSRDSLVRVEKAYTVRGGLCILAAWHLPGGPVGRPLQMFK